MEREHRLLRTVADTAAAGHSTLTAALPLAAAREFYAALEEQLQAYSTFLAEACRLLAAEGLRQPAAGRSRLGSFFVLQVKSMGGEADRQLAALLLQGVHDSVMTLTAQLNALGGIDGEAVRLARRLLGSEEICYRTWKQFL